MNYVPRRIQILGKDGTAKIISDQEFAALDAPLVLLGEPGAGKTDTAHAISAARNGTYMEAHSVVSGAPSLHLATAPVIDGLDEVQPTSSESALGLVLRRLQELGIRSFAVTCRAADWANVQSERAFQNWSSSNFVVGHLEPLDDAEVVEMVDAFGTYEKGGEEFLREANDRHATDLARNPQSLKLLLAAIVEAGWPKTKTDLYQLACENFAKESNPVHQSLFPQRPDVPALLSAAGFACAQLLLSGRRGVNVDGQEDDLFPRPMELATTSISADEITNAISSMLFRSVGVDRVEPTHRTVAEYLGAKWLSAALREGHLSIRRLETLLYAQGIVPSSLRGLHAWLATLDREVTDRLVSHDPYGCLRYGDVEQYSVRQVRALIAQLQNLATIDPHFRTRDWGAQLGGGLARNELRGEIVDLIRNPDVPVQLSAIVLESLSGSELAAEIRDDLRQIIFDEGRPEFTRDRAFRALQSSDAEEDWIRLAESLVASGEYGSVRMASEIAVAKVSLFDQECRARC